MTSGNAQTTGGSVAGNVSRKEGNNRLTFDAGAAYGRSNVVTPVITTMTDADDHDDDQLDHEHRRGTIETTNNWFTKGRYDWFFTPNNSGYVSAQAAADEVAGKTFYGGGQIGYSRQVYKSAMHLLVAELGYDLLVRTVRADRRGRRIDPVTIHSARAVRRRAADADQGDRDQRQRRGALQPEQGERTRSTPPAPRHDRRRRRVRGHPREREARPHHHALQAARASASGSRQVRSEPGAAPHSVGLACRTRPSQPGFVPFADKVDTQTEATLVYTFL